MGLFSDVEQMGLGGVDMEKVFQDEAKTTHEAENAEKDKHDQDLKYQWEPQVHKGEHP